MVLIQALAVVCLAGATPGPSVAVFAVDPQRGAEPALARVVTETVLQEVRRSSSFARVTSPTEIATLMSPAQQITLLKCAQDACALVDMDIAGALGVSHLLVGTVTSLAHAYVLQLKLLELATGKVVG